MTNNTPEYQNKYYKRNIQKRKKYIKTRQKNIKTVIQKLKIQTGCCMCGYNKCAEALHFHHADKNKEGNISRYVSQGRSLINIMNEIDKCEILCSNCHAEKHYTTLIK